MEEDLEPTRELSEFVTLCREAQRTWKAYMHSQTDKNISKFVQAWREFDPSLPAECDLRAAVAQDLMKGVVMEATQAAVEGKGQWETAGRLCAEEAIRKEYNLTKQEQVQKLQKAHATHILKLVVRTFHTDTEALCEAWGQVLEGVGAILDKAFDDAAGAFHVAFSVDVASVSGDEESKTDTLNNAVEFLRGATEDAFVKHVSAVASRILRPLFQEVRGRQGAARTLSKHQAFSVKCKKAKQSAEAAIGQERLSVDMEWAKITQEMAGWRRLSAEAAADAGEATATAFSDLRAAWGSLWVRFFQPALEQYAKQASTLEGCCDSVQHLKSFVAQTQTWLDNRALSQVAPASGLDPVVAQVRIAHAFASAGVVLVNSGCNVSEPTTEHKALLGELAMAMQTLTGMHLGATEVACPSFGATVEVWRTEAKRLAHDGI